NRLYVADVANNRVLGYKNAADFLSGATADRKIGGGQIAKFFSCTGTVSADSLCLPVGLAVDGSGNLYVSDRGNSRVLEYDQPFAPEGGTPGVPGAAGDRTADRV